MKYLLVIFILLAAWVLPAYAEEEACDMLFVQDAKAMVFDGSRLTLKDANPNIIFFCDRPIRTAGHLTLDAFMKLVTEGENNFKSNPPNAAISIFGALNQVTEVVVGLPERPVLSGKDLIFTVKVIEGNLPAEGGPVVMFIDPIGRPLSPGSVAGVHRRHRRRAIMRH
jgi:hypothetical protein